MIEKQHLKYELNEREQVVLYHIIRQYIQTASPIGSRTVSKQSHLHLSAASIRNIMADLEEKGFIDHPHTSAGRIPTDRGYRFYVDTMREPAGLDNDDRTALRAIFDPPQGLGTELVIREGARILGQISQLLAVVSTPHIGNSILLRLELVQVSSTRILVVLTVSSGLVKTILFEIDSETSRDTIDRVSAWLNERLAGLTLFDIRATLAERVRDIPLASNGIIEVFLRSSDKLFSDQLDDARVLVDGMSAILQQPEFVDPERLRNIVDLIEKRNVIVHLLDVYGESDAVTIRIGSEIEDEHLRDYSIVAAPYAIGPLTGTVSVVGPRRMNYPRMIALVDYLSELISSQRPIA